MGLNIHNQFDMVVYQKFSCYT
uniref:Uncharacterized protein n=1 Tax=Rhizophora mucronata TaxID=61149 RepID=A0A2P2P2J6_RHIMU